MSTWFITGASRGLGLHLARTALAHGDTVVAAVRDPARLPGDLQRSGRVLGVRLDVTRDQKIAPATVETAVQRFGNVDVQVNNAGRGLLGALEITDAEARSLFGLVAMGSSSGIGATTAHRLVPNWR